MLGFAPWGLWLLMGGNLPKFSAAAPGPDVCEHHEPAPALLWQRPGAGATVVAEGSSVGGSGAGARVAGNTGCLLQGRGGFSTHCWRRVLISLRNEAKDGELPVTHCGIPREWGRR